MPSKYLPIQCSHCKELFQPKRASTRFCSRKCVDLNRRIRPRIKDCINCGEEFSLEGLMGASSAKITCSKECATEWVAKSKRFLEEDICDYCGADFMPKTVSHRYCSHRCASDDQIKKPDEFHHFARSYRRTQWPAIRDEIRKRDNYTCQICFRDHTEVWLHVHHIVPLREFWPDRVRDSEQLSNLITLCENCHPQVEWGKIECPVPKD